MSDYLPHDAVVEILSRLPVKSLLRFRCVCKWWRSLITSPDFINTHLNQTTNANNLLLIRYFSANPKTEKFILRFDSENLDEYAEFKSPIEARYFYRVVGTCNGLICLSDDWIHFTYNMIIWNPAIRRYLKLPKPSVSFDSVRGPYMYALGFGCDVSKIDYKVVSLTYIGSGWTEKHVTTLKVELFALSTGSWRTIEVGVPSYSILPHIGSQVFLNGSVHWVGYNKSRNNCFYNVILSFDMTREVLRVMEIPRILASVVPSNFSVGLCRDKLALFMYDDRIKCQRCAALVMEEYGVVESWTMRFIVDMEGGVGTLLAFRENGELILQTRDNELVSYDPINKNSRTLGIRSVKDSYFAGDFAESLVLLTGLDGDVARQVKSYDVGPSDASVDDEEVDEYYLNDTAIDDEEVDEDYLNDAMLMNYIVACDL